MNDSLQRFILERTPVRGEIVHLDATWRAVLDRRDYPETLRALLGEMMAAGALLSATLKFDGAMIMQMQGEGPVRLLVVEVTSEQTMRATAKWEGDIDNADLKSLVGDGRFVITIVPNGGRQTYQGIVGLEGNSVSEVLEHYMLKSEQLETRLWLTCDARKAAGMMLQKMPAAQSQDPDAWNRAVKLGETITPDELLKLPAQDIVHRLYHEEDVRLFDARPVAFRCSCSVERVTAMLRMLGREEVQSIIQERERVDVDCEFCGRHYSFDAVDAELVFASEIPLQAPTTRQ